MRLDNKRLLSGVVGSALAAGSIMASASAASAAAAPAGATASVLSGSGSDTTVNMMRALDGIFGAASGCPATQTTGQTLNGACQAPGSATDENPTHDSVNEYYEVGSGNGKNELCNQGNTGVRNVDFARSSSGYGAADCTDLKFVAYARDAIPWWHYVGTSADGTTASPSAGVTRTVGSTPTNDLAQTQLKAIFASCTIRSWKQVPGSPVYNANYTLPNPLPADFYSAANFDANVPVLVFTAQPGSGTLSTFNGFVGGDSTTCIPAGSKTGVYDAQNNPSSRVIFENDATPILTQNAAGATGGKYSVRDLAIFPYSLGRFTQNTAAQGGAAGANNNVGAIDGIVANEGTVTGATTPGYPYARSLYNVYRYAAAPTLNYIKEDTGFLCRPVDSTGASGFAMSTATRAKIDGAIRGQGFFPFASGASGSGGNSFCRLTTGTGAQLDSTAPTASIAGIPSGQRVATLTFSEPVVNVSAATVGLRIGGTAVGTAITCLDASSTALPCNNPAKGAKTVQLALTDPAQPGATYTAFATGGITDRVGNALVPASADFASPYVAPQTVTVTDTRTVTQTVTVPGQTTTVTKTVTVTSSLPVLVIGKITTSGTTLKLPVTCVNFTCTGKVTLKINGKTVTRTYRVSKGSITTLSFGNTRPKGAKAGKTSLTFQLVPSSGQTSLGKRSGTVKI